MTETLDVSKQANLCRHLAHAAITTPKALAVAVQQSQRGQLNYREIDFEALHQQSDAIAYALNAYGLKSGMKTVLMVTPSIEFFALTFALFKAGIIPILVDPGMGIKNLKQCFVESTPDAFIGIPKAHIARKLFGWGKSSVKKLLTVTEAGSGYIAGASADMFASLIGGLSLTALLKRYPVNKGQAFEMVKLNDDDMSAILFTSGSTGTPKGVVYSHKMFEAQITALKEDYGITPGERDLATFPLFSLFGPALGMASIVPDMDASKPITANPDFIFAAIEKYQCTNLFANPALIEVLGQAGAPDVSATKPLADASVKKIAKVSVKPSVREITKAQVKLPSLKRVISAGAPATLPSIERFTQLLSDNVPVLTSYGATESLPLTKISSADLLATSHITDNGGGICVGSAVNGVEISIIAINEEVIAAWSDELALPANTIGEIVVKGDMVSHQYYHRDLATAQAKISDGDSVRHRMGDLGYLDEAGLLWMCGRKAHRVETGTNSKRKTLFSIPCERIFNTHSAVKRTALVAVTIYQKSVPLLCIELTDEAKQDESFDDTVLFSALKGLALAHKQTAAISHFLIHEDFPVDIRHNAKIFREKLAVWAQDELD